MTASTSDLTGVGTPPAQAFRLGYQPHVGNPTGSVIPSYIGQELLDTTGKIWYKSVGLTNADWRALNA